MTPATATAMTGVASAKWRKIDNLLVQVVKVTAA
jgi:hypothetical protein